MFAILALRAGVFRTIRARMLFSILAVAAPIYAGALYLSWHATAQRLEAQAERGADELAARLAAGLDAVIRPIEGGIRTVAGQLEEVRTPQELYPARIRGILTSWPDVYGSTIAVEVADDAGTPPFAPYLFRRGGDIAFSDLALESYQYRELAWYRSAADSLRPVWSLPYFDAGGGEAWMITYSVPFFRKAGNGKRVLAGVVTADLDLNWMGKAAANVPLGKVGMGWLVSPSPIQPFLAPIGATRARLERFDTTLNAHALRGAAEGMLARNTTWMLLPRELSAQPAYLAVRKLETLGWRLVLLIPRAELLAEARRLLERQLWLGGAGLLLLIIAIFVTAAAIARPVRALARAVGRASAENLAFALPAKPRADEVGVLTEALRRLRDSLQTHVQLRAETLAAQARLEHDLQIAARIQQSMLPGGQLRALPAGAHVGAALLAAKQVGGDLYDYFPLDDTRLLFAIADVSDKGIPAALFMARLSTLLRVLATPAWSPGRLLREINARLVEDNDACMFVTLGCGTLDLSTGRIQYASAGHDPPLLRTQEGGVKSVAVDNGVAIGIEADAQYPVFEAFIAPGDMLVLYTDGLTEATSTDNAAFGTERLCAQVDAAAGADAPALVKKIVDSVAAAGFRATDDLTVLAIGLQPVGVSAGGSSALAHWRIEPALSAAGAVQAHRWLRAILRARDIAPERIGDAELVAEELLTNVVRSLEARGGPAHLSFECALSAQEIVLTVRDDGPPFDPLAHVGPDLASDIAQRDIGGLGIVLVRELADRCHYQRLDGYNVMEVRFDRFPSMVDK